MFQVIETFLSIDGEGPFAGRLAAFIRFKGCNLRCSWCDTAYSYDASEPRLMTAGEIYDFVKESGAESVTITGGEPLLQENLPELLKLLTEGGFEVSIETNGSVDITELKKSFPQVCFIVDYKLKRSGMSDKMCTDNFSAVRENDAYKFVSADKEDLEQSLEIINKYSLSSRTQVFLSPVLGQIEPAEIVEFMKENKMNGVRLQLQLHKYIWNPEMRGV